MDIRLYYQEKGTGMPFVLLRGNDQDGNYFKAQVDHFSKNYHVITVDTRGYGKSPRGTAPFTMDQFVDDLNYLLESLKLSSPAILLGFSDGANIAMKFALKYPDKIKTLILNSGNLNTEGVKGTTQFFIELGYRIAKKFAHKSAEAKKNAEILGLMVSEPNLDARELNQIKAPTLVIAGTKDMIKEDRTREIARSIPNAKLVFIPGGHFVAEKQPVGFNRAVDEFLSKA